ncbi:hypothetical protein K1W69_05790 [Hoeflea sp. WL0058]|uniref:Uncharacterized protein n=1 Tax=Flavimaribacter sediminis TaxID=2865987 RepID=A0AAE3D0F9_9HYPH|nr:hypothetical protein [Flavimaribacter sediminis]MBW8636696.1 hypothetical protein [Flavimaribacter sediminis]
MKTLLLAAIMSMTTVSAIAMNTYNTRGMTCAQIQSALKRDGIAQLHYASPRNPGVPLYDTFVASSRDCRSSSMSKPAYVTTRDTRKCQVRQCVRKSRR